MVRPQSEVWNYFTVSKKDAKRIAKCNFCSCSYNFPNATRMVNHILTKCCKCPKDVKQRMSLNAAQKEKTQHTQRPADEDIDGDLDSIENFEIRRSIRPTSVHMTPEATMNAYEDTTTPQSQVPVTAATLVTPPTTVRASVNNSTSFTSPTSSTSASTKIDSYFERCLSEDLKKKIDEALARALYKSGAPLSFFDDESWETAFRLLRQSYKLPSPHSFSKPLLEAEYLRVMEASENKINSALCLALLSDGWTNVNGDGLINFIVTTPEPVFYKIINHGENRETAAYISEQLLNVIDNIGNGKFILIVTDNASNMRAAWSMVQETYPHISAVGCASHSLNLLLNDIMRQDTLKQLHFQAKQLIAYIKNKHTVYATFKSKQSEKYGNRAISLKLPSKTRWGAVVISLGSLLQNKEALQETVIVEDLNVERTIKKIALDDDIFWTRVQKSLALLQPVTEGIAITEADSALLSDVPECYLKITGKIVKTLASSPLTKTEEKAVQACLQKRKDFTLKPIHAAANLLDPRYRGKNLNDDQIADAFDHITSQALHLGLDVGKVLSNVAEFRTSSGLWNRQAIWDSANHITPYVWWQGLCTNQYVAPIASRLLNVPPSSAACERNWSAVGHIHTKSRNRLSNARVEKLVAVRSNLKFCSRPQVKKSNDKPAMSREVKGQDQAESDSGTVTDSGSEGDDDDGKEDNAEEPSDTNDDYVDLCD